MRIVHLPFYDDNPYQSLLMEAQRSLGHEVRAGGGGGNFLGVALREWQADIIHFHWLHPYLLRRGGLASVARATRFLAEVALLKLSGARIAWTIHNLVNHDGRHAAIERRFTRLFAALADTCFVHSNAAASAAQQSFSIPAAKLHVIPHGHYIDVYPNVIGRAEARGRLGLAADARVYLFLGRIEPYKGVFDLVDAFKALPDPCHLVIAGKVADSGQLQELRDRCEGQRRIHCFPQRVPDEELQVFFNAADVVVFPFRRILTSGSLVMAMSFGKAVVAPRAAGLREVVAPEGGRWFDPDVAGSLQVALQAFGSADLAASGGCNLNRARQWDWTSIAAQIVGRAGPGGRGK